MVTTEIINFNGIYELPEATRYLYVTSPKKPPRYSALRRWARSGLSLGTAPSLRPRGDVLSLPRGVILTFEDLVSLRMVIALREAGFSLQHIRRVHKWLQEATGYPRPFVLKDLWVSETGIFIKMEGFLLSVTRGGQYAMEFIKEWLRRLARPTRDSLDMVFSKVGGNEVASQWTPHPHVVLNPLVQFGAPCLKDTRIPTKAIWSMYMGGDNLQAIASAYGLQLEKVKSGLEWEKKLAGLTI